MTDGSWSWCARGLNWWLRRNPLYLFSAAAMALGARWYLVGPDAEAGKIGLILLTLGILQAYELAVTGVIIALHRARKSPEDQPSLLLVAAMFWTGPMAATVEMIAQHGQAGMGFAIGACVIALVEMQTVRRAIGLRLSLWSQTLAAACVLLLTAAPAWLRVPYETEGTDEIVLYYCWWIMAGIILAGLGVLSWNGRQAVAKGILLSRLVRDEMLFLLIVCGATVTHLWGMNYAFFGNARAFYGVPVLAAATILFFEYAARCGIRSRSFWFLSAAPPVIGVYLSGVGFHANVDVQALPVMFRDPLLMSLIVAMLAWWYGCLRHGPAALLHAGSIAGVFAALRIVGFSPEIPNAIDPVSAAVPITRYEIALLLYALTVYLLTIAWLRRGRGEIVAALVVHCAAFVLIIHDRYIADMLYQWSTVAWTWLAIAHVVMMRPGWRYTIWPVIALIAISVYFGLQPELKWYAVGHAGGMVAVLMVIGLLWRWTRYLPLGLGVAIFYAILGIGRGLAYGEHPRAAVAVLGAFFFLLLGACVSWYKQRLLSSFAHCDQAGD